METIHIDEHFACPVCGSNFLREVRSGVIMAKTINAILPDGGAVYGGYELLDRGKIERYQCRCGYTIDAKSPKELASKL